MFTKVIMDQSGALAFLLTENYMLQAVKTARLRCGRIALVLSDYGERNPREVVIDTAQAQ